MTDVNVLTIVLAKYGEQLARGFSVQDKYSENKGEITWKITFMTLVYLFIIILMIYGEQL